MKRFKSDQALSTELSRVLHTQHKMRTFLNTVSKSHPRSADRDNLLQENGTSVVDTNCILKRDKAEVDSRRSDRDSEGARAFDAARDLLVQSTSLQSMPQPCSRLWFACVLCEERVHSLDARFIHNAGLSKPWIPVCTKCHIALASSSPTK